MKKIFYLILVFLFNFNLVLKAEDEDVNVISYYAVNNSIDGQPYINKMNVLRFFPVFTLRQEQGVGITDTVKITIYHGSSISAREAVMMDCGKYWEVLLPKFQLGEAIQKIEVETHIELTPTRLINLYNTYLNIYAGMKQDFKDYTNLKQQIERASTILNSFLTKFVPNEIIDSIHKFFKVNQISSELEQLNNFETLLSQSISNTNQYLDTIKAKLKSLVNISDSNKIYSLISDIPDKIGNIMQYKNELSTFNLYFKVVQNAINEDVKSICENNNNITIKTNDVIKELSQLQLLKLSNVDSLSKKLDDIEESINSTIEKSILRTLLDTNAMGQGVRRADIVLDKEFKWAKILYRNYKTSLRYLPALDPAENVGLFRARFVPLAVLGNGGLSMPFKDAKSTIFEFGLSFGDKIVSYDDIFISNFSYRKFGIAIAVSPKLFADDADILALVLTYDVNSFASLGIGANFRGVDRKFVETYFSFGINKRLFENLLSSMQKVFE
jgi:hypothetical protein